MFDETQAMQLGQDFHQNGSRGIRCRIGRTACEQVADQLARGKRLAGLDQYRKKRSVDVVEKMNRIIEAVVNDKLPVRFPPVQARVGGERPESGRVVGVRLAQGCFVRSRSSQDNQ